MEKYSEEIKNLIENSQDGNWVPFGIVLGCLGVIGFLIVVILKMKEKQLVTKQTETSDLIKEVSKGHLALEKIVLVHETEINNLKG